EKGSSIGLDNLPLLVDVVDPEAEMVRAHPVFAALQARGFVGFVLEQGKAHYPIGKIYAVGNRRIRWFDNFHVEDLAIELCCLLGIGNSQCDVSQLCHDVASLSE